MASKGQITEQQCLKGLADTIYSLRSSNEVLSFLEDLCTPAELQAMTGRWQVAMMLEKNIPYRRINELTGVSTATITRVAKFIGSERKGYKNALEVNKSHQSSGRGSGARMDIRATVGKTNP